MNREPRTTREMDPRRHLTREMYQDARRRARIDRRTARGRDAPDPAPVCGCFTDGPLRGVTVGWDGTVFRHWMALGGNHVR